MSGTLTVTVTAAALTAITVTPPPFTLFEGQPQPQTGPPLRPTQQLAATGNYSDGTSPDLTSVVTWSVPDGSDLLVTPAGLAIAVSAKWVGITETTVVTVGPALVLESAFSRPRRSRRSA